MDLINNCTEGADRSILAREHPTSDSCLKRQGAPYYKKYITPQCILKITQETITYCITPSTPELPDYTSTEHCRLSADILHWGLFKNISPNLVAKVQHC